MDDNKNPRDSKESPVVHRWGLMITMSHIEGTVPPKYQVTVKSENDGMNDSDVILMVERWLDVVKEKRKKLFMPDK